MPPLNPIPISIVSGKEGTNTDISAKYMLLKARNDAHMTRQEAGNALFVSPDVIKRWEDTGCKVMPTSLDVSRMETLYSSPNLWHRWMKATDEVYRDHYPYDIPDYPLLMAIVNARHQQTDLIGLYDLMERDAIDGHVDNRQLLAASLQEAMEAREALDEMIARLKDEQKGG